MSRWRINAKAGIGTIDFQILIQLCQTWKLLSMTKAGLRGANTPLTRLCPLCAQLWEDRTTWGRRHNMLTSYCPTCFLKDKTSLGVLLRYGPLSTVSKSGKIYNTKSWFCQFITDSFRSRIWLKLTRGYAVFLCSVSTHAFCCRNTVFDCKALPQTLMGALHSRQILYTSTY